MNHQKTIPSCFPLVYHPSAAYVRQNTKVCLTIIHYCEWSWLSFQTNVRTIIHIFCRKALNYISTLYVCIEVLWVCVSVCSYHMCVTNMRVTKIFPGYCLRACLDFACLTSLVKNVIVEGRVFLVAMFFLFQLVESCEMFISLTQLKKKGLATVMVLHEMTCSDRYLFVYGVQFTIWVDGCAAYCK